MMRKVGKYLLILFLTLPPAAEIAARIIGWTPLRNDDFYVDSTPTPWIRGSGELGFKLVPGSFDIVLNHSLRFHTTHLSDGSRAVGATSETGPSIIFTGCSYTYGYGVNDEETFVAQLQKHYPSWHFDNLAVPGYGTAQALHLLEKSIEKKKLPAVWVLMHSSAHEERDVFARSWRKALKIGFLRSNENVNRYMQGGRFPYYDVHAKKLRSVAWNDLYSNWYGRETFAIVNALQSSSESDTPKAEQQAGSRALIRKMEELCAKHGIRFVVFDLDGSALSRADLRESTVFGELNFNFSARELINYPVDRHPNKKGHALLSERINKILSPLLHE